MVFLSVVLGTCTMKVDYVSHMGDDLMVVNAARVSFAKHKEEFGEDDNKLLSYLAKHQHWTPFAHPQICLRIKAPIFVRTQLFKHKVGFTENEVSRRYVDDIPEFFDPLKWRARPKDGAKQGSSDEEVTALRLQGFREQTVSDGYARLLEHVLTLYEDMIEAGVAPEQARMILPQSMYTEWYWTGSLASYARMCRQRLDAHAQKETQTVAQLISNIIEPLFPHSWKVLLG